MRNHVLSLLAFFACTTAVAHAENWSGAPVEIIGVSPAVCPNPNTCPAPLTPLAPNFITLKVNSGQGLLPDPNSPTGFYTVQFLIPLSDFARADTVDGLGNSLTTLQTSFAALSANFAATNAALSQALQLEARQTRSGIAQSLAMAGTADLQSDENYAVSMNVGTFGGQTAFAGGMAARIDAHVSINAGVTAGVNGGPVGARAGIRFGW
jgi:hypothetical protein